MDFYIVYLMIVVYVLSFIFLKFLAFKTFQAENPVIILLHFIFKIVHSLLEQFCLIFSVTFIISLLSTLVIDFNLLNFTTPTIWAIILLISSLSIMRATVILFNVRETEKIQKVEDKIIELTSTEFTTSNFSFKNTKNSDLETDYVHIGRINNFIEFIYIIIIFLPIHTILSFIALFIN